MSYNKKIFGSLLIMSLVVPQVLLAAGTTTKNTKTTNFCTNIDSYLAEASNKKSVNDADKLAKLDKRASELAARRAERDKKISESEAKAIAKQNENFAKVQSKATTDAQKNAVNQFITGAKSALATRQSATSQARTAYRAGLDQLLAARKTKIVSAIAVHKASIDAAALKAKADCANNVPGETVKTNFSQSVKSAKETLNTTIKGLGKLSDQTSFLEQTKKSSIESANTTFKKSIEALKTTLKSQLG